MYPIVFSKSGWSITGPEKYLASDCRCVRKRIDKICGDSAKICREKFPSLCAATAHGFSIPILCSVRVGRLVPARTSSASDSDGESRQVLLTARCCRDWRTSGGRRHWPTVVVPEFFTREITAGRRALSRAPARQSLSLSAAGPGRRRPQLHCAGPGLAA